MTVPKVSVIIPTYNRAAFVVLAIESVLSQHFTDYEIIVVDDGSQDNTKERMRPYNGRIKYLYQPNSGVSAARNTGSPPRRENGWLSWIQTTSGCPIISLNRWNVYGEMAASVCR
jgi:glycosyltransferase involved in cell wall biosynthesis